MCSVKHWLAALVCAGLLAAEGASAAAKRRTATDPPIDLNTAAPIDLRSLPGVGPATVKKIIAGRPYSSVHDLARAGVSRKTIEVIAPMVTASGASDPASAEAPKQAPQPPVAGMVWVNLETKVYHKSDSRWFGTTRNGKYLTEADARSEGYQAAKD